LEANLKALDDLGGPKYFNHYPWGWTWAGNTPFKRWKRETYRGGVSDPLIVHWPKGIQAKGEIRPQYAHAIDLLPTVLDALQIEPPAEIRGVTQSPIEGVSFAHTFNEGKAESRRVTQYFEMFGHRSIYHDGWRAVCPVPGPSFAESGMAFGQMEITEEKLRELDAHGWELYHVAEDFSETRNLADQHRDKLIEMIAMWYVEAGKYNVLPLDSRGTQRFVEERPQLTPGRQRYVYYPDTSPVPDNVAVKVLNRPHSITAEVEIHDSAEGVLLAHGGSTGGYSFFVKDKKLCYVHNYVGVEEFGIVSDVDVPQGKAELRFEFEPTGQPDPAHGKGSPGRGQLYIDGKLVGQAEFPVTVPLLLSLGEGLTCGQDAASQVTSRYEVPFAFSGKLNRVTVDVSGELIGDKEAELRAIITRQ
jgi:arylsulfatase